MQYPINLSKEPNKLFLCEWNGGEIIEIHTINSFYHEYKDTNVYDDNEFIHMFNKTIHDVFDELETGAGDWFDNMFIQRIK